MKPTNPNGPKKLGRDTLKAAVARFFISSNIPYQVVEYESFKELLALCNPATKSLLCGRETLSTFIHSCFNQGQNLLRNQFQKIKSKLSLTCDVWTSPANLSVLGVTAHWIDRSFELKAIVLGAKLVEGNHSGVTLATHLAKLINNFKL